MHFFIRKSAPMRVPLIFAASVCATFWEEWRWCISHAGALGDVEWFYEQWQVFFGYYDAVFFDMDRWCGS